jgi:hypothetical protein
MVRLLRFATLGLGVLVLSSGCDISARPYAGAVLQIILEGVVITPPGQHLEIWARDGKDDVVRINPIVDHLCEVPSSACSADDVRTFQTKRLTDRYGFLVRPAAHMSDPCMIDEEGHLLTSSEAYPEPVTSYGVEQTPEDQAAQVRDRIGQLSTGRDCDNAVPRPHCGRQPDGSLLLAMVTYDPNLPPVNLPYDTGPCAAGCPDGSSCRTFNAFEGPRCHPTPEARLSACLAYWGSPHAYTPNPAQLTAPKNGAFLGALNNFITISPPGGFNGFRIDTPVSLKGLRELFITVEGDVVNPLNRGPVLVQGYPVRGGNGWVQINLLGAGASGQAAVFVDPDVDPVQF